MKSKIFILISIIQLRYTERLKIGLRIGTSLLPMPENAKKRKAIVAIALLGLAVFPIFLAPFPPSTDLPQHVAQIRLFHDALHDSVSPYTIQWAGPNNLIYVFIALFWAIFPPGLIIRLTMALIVILWIVSIHYLAALRNRPTELAVLASLLVFNQSLYWGFLNFLIGFPVFIMWFFLTTRDAKAASGKLFISLAGLSFFLYGSHALWLAAGGAWLVIAGFLKKLPLKIFLFRLAALVPCLVLALFWYPHLFLSRAGAGFDVAPHWSPVFDRLSSLLDAAFGGVRGPVETLAFVFIYCWAALTIWRNRKRLKDLVDRDLMAAGAFFLIIVLLAPGKYMNTIFFSSRWFPLALIFLLLALPSPALDRRAMNITTAVVVAAFFLTTTFAWKKYGLEDLSGFQECLNQLPASSRVLGLDLIKESSIIKGRPFLQLFAYAQVFKGCELNFSFAEHYSGLVAYRTIREVPWTLGLEWYAERVKRTDFGYFDYVLVNGGENDHKTVLSFKELSSMTPSGRWRLYRVGRNVGYR